MATSEEGYLLIADITGYTSYLSRSELEHAQEALTSLLTLLIEHTKPPLVISRLAGDAVISYGLRSDFLQAQTFAEMIEDTYVAFRRAIDLMVLNTTCPCNACRNLPSLDLKFFVHFGVFGIQRLGSHDELVGSDVNLIHRLLKNRVVEATGIEAYTMYTDAAIRSLGMDATAGSMLRHREEYEHLGEAVVWVQDMHPVWERKRDLIRIPLDPSDVLKAFSTEVAVSAERLWDFLVQPDHFNVLAGGSRTVISERTGGRVGEGSTYQCYHGDAVFPQTILEWRPFERIVVRFTVPIPVDDVFMLIEYRLDPIETGTRLWQTFTHATGPEEGRALADETMLGMADMAQHDIDEFGRHVAAAAPHDLAVGSPPGPRVVADAVAQRLQQGAVS